ncbi:LysR family transcriptional regulator [Magnetospira sp. QH-2]|uniref:LysR family transcriptional regulator n=1 Tax=Magnetospira sp. (strain QH-2) TaxID=1288970 RepID=UPI0003E80CD8|nr:LysR family transcriptional regulator [Magnetospira sp. QH-2]CCQ74456.1 Putative transcriptional regulatory protein [Magnetospira sp. QH-2]
MKHLLPLHYIEAVARAGSIRKAADTLAITSTALNRRILAMEEDLGVQIFERLPRGVRLSAAGEIFIHHIRSQLSDMERVKSQIADLSGERRGHIAIACSQALIPYFLPEQISHYRKAHPAVTFGVLLRDREAAERALVAMSADLALVFEPVRMAEFEVLLTVRQPVHAVMTADHPLASQDKLRLRDCLAHPVALPTEAYGVRHLLEAAVPRTSMTLDPVIESDSFEFLRSHALAEDILTFQIPIGLPAQNQQPGLVSLPLDERDVPPGVLRFGQLKGRTLPVAAARFAQQLLESFAQRFDCA